MVICAGAGKKRPGRPPVLSIDGFDLADLHVKTQPDLKDQIQKRADELRIPMSDYVRITLSRDLQTDNSITVLEKKLADLQTEVQYTARKLEEEKDKQKKKIENENSKKEMLEKTLQGAYETISKHDMFPEGQVKYSLFAPIDKWDAMRTIENIKLLLKENKDILVSTNECIEVLNEIAAKTNRKIRWGEKKIT